MTDAERVEHVQRLFLQHAGLLRGFILGFLPDFHRADDVFQETFLTAARKADEFTPGSDFLAWARAIARFKALEACREGKPGVAPLDPQLMETVAEAAPQADASWERDRAALARCLEQVAPRAREILALRYSEGLAPAEIARRLSWSAGALYVALARVRKFLRECMRRAVAASEA